MFIRALLAVTFAAALPLPASAYCYEPSAPSCASSFTNFTDQYEFDRCKREMESYRSDVESFISCNNDEAQEAINKAQRENESASSAYGDAVDSFNRRASR